MSLPTVHEWLDLLGQFYEHYGYLVVFLGTLGENTAFLGFFLPGNSLALLGALYAHLGTLQLGWVVFFATLGTVLGYHVDYLFGRFILVHVATRWSAGTLGRRMRLSARLRLGRRFLKKHGGKAILISHLIGHLRSFVAMSAGMIGMPYRRFLGYELVAAALWNSAFCLLGFVLAGEIGRLQLLIQRAGWLVIAILIVSFLIWRWTRQRVRQRLLKKRQEARAKGREPVVHSSHS
ncbi:MAG TPA: DedA family protein [Ktedonobacteraceae bacterium]|nr:DedA family protein [Ktedonobacteraceae bacterium]